MSDIPYQVQFDAAKAALPGDLLSQREAAFARFVENGFPTQRSEAWRYTRLSPIASARFEPSTAGSATAADIVPHRLEGAINLVFTNGRFAPELSDLSDLSSEVTVESLAQASSGSALSSALSSVLANAANETSDDALIALNTALMSDGAVIRIEKGASLERPIHLLFYASTPGMTHLRNLIIAGAGSMANIVESYVSAGNETYWNNVVNQVVLDGDCTIRHTKLQNESRAAYHISATKLHMAAGDRFDSVMAHLGGTTARHEVDVSIQGEGADCRLAGLSLGQGKQLLDTITKLDHAVPNCTSDQMFKAVLNDASHAIYQGKVIVRQDAQHTDAKQANHNLLLSRDAEATSKPELEIFADDVKCAHGATVGELDQNMMFYLKARGIDEATAQQLLIEGFVTEVLDRIENETIRNHFAAAISKGAKQ
ncbi:MAG: Fe-S cluster assembly protein SufD [Proteobacteria bacterium]|nr:Fe-S cluster assembly protein SufD [Pseudomonadota bacterium]